jgi:DNA-binding NarL/FixJ family response regulator
LSGLRILPELHASYPRTPFVMLFDSWQDDLIVHAFRVGAQGVFCRVQSNLDLLWKCIKAVHQGQVWANSGQLNLLLMSLRAAAPIRAVDSRGEPLLAQRETQVADLVTDGLSNKGIAAKLNLCEHTVSNYLFRIYNKLGISTRVELALYVMKQRENRQPGS